MNKTTNLKQDRKIALVTGANRGIGRETARQLARLGYEVIGTSRNPEQGDRVARELASDGIVHFHPLDVTDASSIRALGKWVRETQGRLDVLVNNAGIFPDAGGSVSGTALSAMKAPLEILQAAMETNVYGPFLLCQEFLPMMLKQGHGRVVNVSSGMGQLSEMEGGYPGYRLSKTSLNALTRMFAAEMGEGVDVLINSVCPGWVKTDMGGAGAERTPEKGAETLVWLATLPQGGPSGGFFRDREAIAW